MIPLGILQRDALALADQLGVRRYWSGGDIVMMHPLWRRRLKINGRRKDTPRTLVVALRRLEKGQRWEG